MGYINLHHSKFCRATFFSVVKGVLEYQSIWTPMCAVCYRQGGLKAVIWTDVFQTVVMFTGQLAVIVVGVQQTGGVSEVWRKVWEGNRISSVEWVDTVAANAASILTPRKGSFLVVACKLYKPLLTDEGNIKACSYVLTCTQLLVNNYTICDQFTPETCKPQVLTVSLVPFLCLAPVSHRPLTTVWFWCLFLQSFNRISCVQPKPRSHRGTYLLDSGGRRGLPHAVPLWSEPGSGPTISQLTHREGGSPVHALWIFIDFRKLNVFHI